MIKKIDEKSEEQTSGGGNVLIVDMKPFGKFGDKRFELINEYGYTQISFGSEKEAIEYAENNKPPNTRYVHHRVKVVSAEQYLKELRFNAYGTR